MQTITRSVSLALAVVGGGISQTAQAAIDPTAAVVLLRTTCSDVNGTLNNCFTDLNTLDSWIASTRLPAASNPLLVEIGPGTFTGMFSCNNEPSDPGPYLGYVTLRGAGKGNTVITKTAYPISTVGCTNLVFSDMTVLSSGFTVQGGGSNTTWHNVEVRSTSGLYAWFDSAANGCYVPTKGKHYWFSSQIISEGSTTSAYQSSCDESWFFGSEIIGRGTSTSGGTVSAFKLGEHTNPKRGEVHVYGSVIRALANNDSPATLIPVQAHNSSQIHIHGTGIDAIGTMGNSIIALSASNNGEIHANESAYVLNNGTGTSITRISNNGGHVHAPYQWESHATPPAISSQDKSDMTVANDANGLPQLLIYSTACSSGWFDVSSKLCRP